MTDENAALSADTTPPAEAGFSLPEDEGQGAEEQPRDFEAEAKEMGWAPQDEWRGDPDKWIDAESFVERGETVMPILQANNRRLKDDLAKERAENAKRLEKLERVTAAGMERMKAAHKAELDGLKQQMRQAAASGDVETYDKLSKQHDEAAAVKIDEGDSDDPKAMQAEWAARNPWFNDDFEAGQTAINYSQWLANKNPNISMRDNLEQTEKFMREKRPELFGQTIEAKPNGKANGHALVDGGSQMTAPGKASGSASLLAKIPREDLAIGRRQVEEGLFENINEWAKEYNNA